MIVIGEPGFGILEQDFSISEHAGNCGGAGAAAISTIIGDKEVHSCFVIKGTNLVIVSGDLAVPMKKENIGGCWVTDIKSAADGDPWVRFNRYICCTAGERCTRTDAGEKDGGEQGRVVELGIFLHEKDHRWENVASGAS